MPRDGAFTFGDLDGKLTVLRIVYSKCGRAGSYDVAKLIARYGPEARARRPARGLRVLALALGKEPGGKG